VAILSDALHDFGDSLSLGSAWYFQRRARQGRDAAYTYGYKRFSLLGAFVNAMVLTGGSLFIIQEAIKRLVDPQSANAHGMVVLAVIGIAVNGMAMWRLHHGQSINERVISLHFLEDVLGWVAILIGAVVMMIADVPRLDPLLSIGIAMFILYNIYRNIRGAMKIVLQGVPPHLNEQSIKNKLVNIPEIKDVHDIHIWSIDGQYHIMTVHVILVDNVTIDRTESIKKKIREELSTMSIRHITIEFELYDSHCVYCNC
jgi:cobalt-zinc-cadmium efflux system protein